MNWIGIGEALESSRPRQSASYLHAEGIREGGGDGAVCCYLTLPCCAGKGSKGYLSGRVKGGSVAVVTNTRATGDVVREKGETSTRQRLTRRDSDVFG